MKTQNRWIVAALAGVLSVGSAVAAESKDSKPESTDRAGSSPLSTEKSRTAAEASPPSYNYGQSPDPAVKRDREQQGLGQTGTGYSGDRTNDPQVVGNAQGATTSGTGSAASAKTSASPESRELMQKLHAGNLAEIQAGQAMQQTAQNDKVKDFAKMMVKDHQDMDKDLQKYAEKQGVSLTAGASSDPTAAMEQDRMQHMQQMQQMQGMPAAQAERHYMTMMVNDHQADVNEVRSAEQQAKSSNDKDLEKLLSKTGKKMEDHLKDAQKIQRDLGSRQARTPTNQ